MGLRSRNKGKRGEREAAAEIRRLFRTEALRLHEALRQATSDAGPGRVPVVLHKANRRPWVAIVRLDDLPQLAVQLYLTLARTG